ncbi:MAG: zinc-ribbon domain-containing protein [Propionibacteriaceae bacterium]|nr:zinc-ribbon domain-containing protein [Propionibacteriaceae bacterium]
MLLIFGTKADREVLGVLTLACQFCGATAAQRIEKWSTKFTVFFIPLMTVSKRYHMQCASCAAESELSADDAEHLLASGAGRGLR